MDPWIDEICGFSLIVGDNQMCSRIHNKVCHNNSYIFLIISIGQVVEIVNSVENSPKCVYVTIRQREFSKHCG